MSEDATRARVERARRGDPEAFAELFESFRTDVARLCTRLLGAGPEAEDASSEAFLRAQQALPSYDAGQPFRPWLLSIASHHCVDLLRRRSTERRLFAGEIPAEDLPSGGPSPLQRQLRAEARREVLAAVDALPDRYRAPLVLRYYADLGYESIAQTLDVTRGQVATLLFRAKRRLRDDLARKGRT